MCGLVGFIDRQKCLDIIDKMLELQVYRGPDDSGSFYDNNSGVHLGHNRLAIQDLTKKAHQPFVSQCKQYVIVFNGEVYNFQKIRSELKNLGHKFNSSSDTEVVLYSYKQWGMDCLAKFVGMFAFAIHDKKENKLILARDRLGVKPLYYYYNGNNFIFSSELKSFIEHPNFQKQQNLDILPFFFQFGYIPAPHTIFQNCYKLKAGNYLTFDLSNKTFNTHCYWDIISYYKKQKSSKNETQILGDLQHILDDAINLRMIADVPVGIFLSGGYDSSFITAILAKKNAKTINTFTIGFEDEKYNEARHAKSIANYLGTSHNEYYMHNKDMLDLIEKFPFYYDEPFGDSSALATMVVAKKTKAKVGVALSADGGDEVFGGYSKYFALNKIQSLFKKPLILALLRLLIRLIPTNLASTINYCLPRNIKQTNFRDKYLKFKRAIYSKNLAEAFMNASSYVDAKQVANMLKVKSKIDIFSMFDNKDNLAPLDYMMAKDSQLFLSGDVLTKIDRAAMHISLEGREPLLDHRLIEYIAAVPSTLKYKNKQGKYLLRQLLYHYLPKSLVDKPKSGFQIPLNKWLRGDLKHLVNYHLGVNKLNKNIFNVDMVGKLKNEFFSGKDNSTLIWFILVYQMWQEMWLEK